MDAVIVQKSEIELRRQVEDSVEIDGSQQLFGGERANPVGGPLEVLVVPGNQFGGSFGLVSLGGALHGELQVGNAVEGAQVDRLAALQCPGRARAGIGAIVTLAVGHSGQNFLGGFHFVGKAIEHDGAIGQSEFGSDSWGGHEESPLRNRVTGLSEGRFRGRPIL